jgi:transcription elongation GreA/GreB family factor
MPAWPDLVTVRRATREESVSRAFVKEDEQTESLPDRPVSEHPNDVTREGLEQIEVALQSAQEAYAAAQGAGDRAALASASRDLRYWTARRGSAMVAPEPADNSVIRFGHTVTIVRQDDRRQTFRIVGEDEADPRRGTISHVAPLARALFGKGVGEVIRIGDGEAEILSIS